MPTYRNPWHVPGQSMYGPEMYETDVTPTEYRGHQIYQRVKNCWDVVKDGRCLTQRCGLGGAKRYIDAQSA